MNYLFVRKEQIKRILGLIIYVAWRITYFKEKENAEVLFQRNCFKKLHEENPRDFFFYLGFLSRIFTIHGTPGGGRLSI